MISTYNCTDQQVVDWHYRTVCRYQLAAKPGNQGFAANLLKIATNAIAFDRFLKSQKVKKYTLPPRVKIKKVQRNTQELEEEFFNKVLKHFSTFNQRTKNYSNHVQVWKHINKITLHITSGKLLSNIELYPSFYIAFCCFGNQAPQMVRSKRAAAEFGMIKGAIIGVLCHLQSQNRVYFLYKWAFIAAGLPLIEDSSSELVQCLGVDNIFLFPELDKYDYYLFEPTRGFDLTFNNQNKTK